MCVDKNGADLAKRDRKTIAKVYVQMGRNSWWRLCEVVVDGRDVLIRSRWGIPEFSCVQEARITDVRTEQLDWLLDESVFFRVRIVGTPLQQVVECRIWRDVQAGQEEAWLAARQAGLAEKDRRVKEHVIWP